MAKTVDPFDAEQVQAAWPLLHAALHVWGWLEHGFPTMQTVAVSEAVGVVLIGVAGFVVALLNARKQGVV